MYGIYMLTFTINIPQMLAYIPYMDPMGYHSPLGILAGTYPPKSYPGHTSELRLP